MGPSWEAASCADTKEFSNILWNPKIHSSDRKSLSVVYILSHINPVHTTPSFLSKIHFNIVTHMITARQRLGKHVPEVKLSTTEERPKAGIMKSD
jgi:hypothetical protein